MTHDLTSTLARNMSTSDLVIYNEIDTITRAIYTASLAGGLTATVNDGTLMTESTPTITVTSSGAGAFVATQTIVIAGTTITLGDGVGDGTNVYQATADINAAGISGLVATTDGAEITLTYEPPQSAWTLTLAEGNGTALADLGFTAGTVTATDPTSVSYYSMWSGVADDRKKAYEFAQVSNHFQSLGFSILAKKNTTTANTFYWEIYW